MAVISGLYKLLPTIFRKYNEMLFPSFLMGIENIFRRHVFSKLAFLLQLLISDLNSKNRKLNELTQN